MLKIRGYLIFYLSYLINILIKDTIIDKVIK